jgi:hypothetical protein
LEDKILLKDDENSAFRIKIDSLNEICKQLEDSKNEAVATLGKARNELKSMQSSVAASYKLEVAQGDRLMLSFISSCKISITFCV